MSRRRTLIANEIPNLEFQTEEVDDEAEKRNATNRRKSGKIIILMSFNFFKKFLKLLTRLK